MKQKTRLCTLNVTLWQKSLCHFAPSNWKSLLKSSHVCQLTFNK